jgi:cytochrome P450
MQEILERQRGGFLDVGKDVATAVPIARVFRYFGLPQPTTISTAHRALYFRRESFEDVVAMGWYREFPKYRKAEIPLREMAALVRAVAVYLLIDAYETRDTLTAAKLAIGALIDHAVTGLNQAMQNPQALAGTLLGRLYAHATQQPDPVTAYLRAAMILAELTVGSIDTTAKGIVNTIDCLLDHPAALEAARTAVKGGDDRSLDRIIYEALRLQPVAPFLIRECPDGAEIDGAEIEGGRAPLRFAPGGRVFLLLGAAMRDRGGDPEMPADLSGFVLDPGHDARLDPLRHLVFGTPPHDCYGRFMALAEIRQVLKALLAKPNLRRAAGPAGVKREEFRFPVSLGVRFDA